MPSVRPIVVVVVVLAGCSSLSGVTCPRLDWPFVVACGAACTSPSQIVRGSFFVLRFRPCSVVFVEFSWLLTHGLGRKTLGKQLSVDCRLFSSETDDPLFGEHVALTSFV